MSDETPNLRPGDREAPVFMLPPVDWKARHEELRAARIKRLVVKVENTDDR